MRSRRLIPVPVVAVAAFSLLTAGCGGGSSTSAVTTTAGNGALAFARCMRSHGLTAWPDPTGSGVFDKSKLRQLGYSESRVRALAAGPCNHLLPNDETARQTRTRFKDALAFARCMRARGFPSFPDPTGQGELTPQMVTA